MSDQERAAPARVELLTPAERSELVERARGAAERALGFRAAGFSPTREVPPRLREERACVATWYREGRARGSHGTVRPARALVEEAEACAIAALLHDPRVPKPTARDFRALRLEIAIVGTLEPVVDPLALAIGLHGVHVEKGKRHASLLPRVAVDWGWDQDRLLSEACLRAGLPADSWRDTAAVQAFRFLVEVASEEGGEAGPPSPSIPPAWKRDAEVSER